MRKILASALLFAAPAPVMATTFISASVDVGSNATLDTASDFMSDSASSLFPTVLGAFAASSVNSGGYSVQSYADARGDWFSNDAGSFRISWGWDIRAAGSPFTTVAETNRAATNWSYTFTASGDGSFDGSYTIFSRGNGFGLQPIYGTNDSPGTYGGDVYDPTGSGTFSIPLVNGQTYTMAFFNFGNVGNVAGFDAVADGDSHFDWQINYSGAVPEPASWALMVAGFGLVGAAARRRRNSVRA